MTKFLYRVLRAMDMPKIQYELVCLECRVHPVSIVKNHEAWPLVFSIVER